MSKTAIIFFNLGGPDVPAAVRPFLFNLFNDAAIIRLPNPFRYLLAQLIAARRAPIAEEIYAQLGGGSPILPNTRAQALALEKLLNTAGADSEFKTFIAMRYWRPFADETARAVKNFAPDRILLLPLYPQYSTTTTASSVADWNRQARKVGLTVSTQSICCYPALPGFITALTASINTAYAEAQKYGKPRILFSAHGLPEKIVRDGDPYQIQCEMTAAALRRALAIDNLDSILCYQSRVGPLQWIKPATDDEVRRAGAGKVPLVVVPIAFVSDHSETLVEIDIEYRRLAGENGVPFFTTVPAVGAAPDFIGGLAEMVASVLTSQRMSVCGEGKKICPLDIKVCPCSP